MSNKTGKINSTHTPAFLNISENPVVVALQGPLEGQKWEIREQMVIGREQTCDIAIVDRQVSRMHARLTNLGSGKVQLEDLESKNGTFYKGKQLDQSILLEDGDIIQIALIQKFAFYISDATMPMEDLFPAQGSTTGAIRLDPKSRRVWVNDEELNPALSAPQFRLLYALYNQSGKVVSRNELVNIVWEDELKEGVSEQALDALIRRLRNRLAQIDPTREFIATIRGHGIRLEN